MLPLLLGAACRAPSDSRLATDADAPCTAALGFVQLQLTGRRSGRPVVIDTDFGSEAARLDQRALAAVRTDLSPDAPPLTQLRAMAATTESAVAACPSLTAFLRGQGIGFGRAAADRILESGGDPYGADIIGVSLPVVGADGRDALLVARFASGGDRATGTAYHLRRGPDGGWTIAGISPLWFRVGPDLRLPPFD